MSIKSKMLERAPRGPLNEAYLAELTERNARADRLVEKWSRLPEIGSGLRAMRPHKARNLAILLENQARHMKRLTETQYSSAFAVSPENMIRLVRLTYPNSIRDKIFTDFAMETAKDSIKYIKPKYTADPEINRSDILSINSNYRGPGKGFSNQDKTFPEGYRSPITYESTQSRFPGEIANGTVTVSGGSATISFTTDEFSGGRLIDGYTTIFSETGLVLATQTGVPGQWLFSSDAGTNPSITGPTNGQYTYTGFDPAKQPKFAQARYDSEQDIRGEFLGEVEIGMEEYQFKIRPLTLGVSWTNLAELMLDTTTGVSAEEILLDAAAQEIKKALDFQAVKYAYQVALSNGNGIVSFNANGGGSGEPYIHIAQTVTQAIEQAGDTIYNNLNRGGVSRIVGGPKAVSYLSLSAGFTTEGAQPRIGGYQVGELYGIPVFKVPSSIIPTDRLLCVWKNENNEADVSIAFGTLVPFFSTGVIQRKNFYKEAGLASYGDYKALNPKYLIVINIYNIR